jgi:hypothetical protein
MGASNYLTTAYNAVSNNEVSGNSAIADRITLPNSNTNQNGNGGWTIGYNQEDFNTNSSQAQLTLENALVASQMFTLGSATEIAQALTTAGTSSTVNLAGINNVHGNPATIASINAALQTSGAAQSISNSSLNDFTALFNNLNSTVLQNTSLSPAVQNALADPTEGPLLTTVLADYDNQYPGGITQNGPMMQLLMTGNTIIGGNQVILDTTNSATVTQSVMSAILSTQWVSYGNGPQATARLTNDVAAADLYDTTNGLSLPGVINLTSNNGDAVITPSADGATFAATWVGGSSTGTCNQIAGTDTLDLTGVNNLWDLNDWSIALGSGATANVSGTFNTITSTAPGSGNVITLTGSNNTADVNNSLVSIAANAADTVAGNTVSIAAALGSVATLTGNGDTVSGPANPTSSTGITVTVVGNTETLGYSYTTTVLSANTTGNIIVGNDNSANLTGTGAVVVLSGNYDTATQVAGDTIGVSGNGDTVSGSNATVDIAANSSATVNGNSVAVDVVGTGARLLLNGNNGVVTVTSSGGAFDLSGDTDTVNTSAGGIINVAGNGADGANGSDHINGSSATVDVSPNGGAVVTGNSDVVSAATNDAVSMNGDSNGINAGAGDYVYVSGNGAGGANGSDGVYGTDLTVDEAANAGVVIGGTLDTINGNSGDLVALGATGNYYDTVDMSGGDISAAAGSVNSYGNSDTINASDVVITLGSNETHETIVGSGDVVNAGDYDLITFDGSDDRTYGSYDVVDADGSDDDTYGDFDTDDGDEDDGGDGDDTRLGGSGTGATISTANGSVTLKNGEAATLTGSSDTVTVANNDTLTIASALGTVAMSGKGSTVADDGLFNAIAVSGASNAVNISANEGVTALQGSVVTTFSGGSEVLAIGGGNSVTVAGGVTATIIGSDGTLTANNSATAPKNTINWSAGGSEVETFTTSAGGGYAEDDIGYSGSSGTGTKLYTQVTTTSSSGSGAVTSAISGNGVVSGLSGADITLANAASSTLTGGEDTVSLGNKDSLTLNSAQADTVTLSGNGSTVTDNSASQANSYSLSGTKNTATLSGSDDSVMLGGTSNTAVIASGASSGSTVISGTNDTVNIAGTSSESITFDLDALGTLLLQSAQSFTGTVAGLASGDGIDLTNFGFANGATISNVTGTGAAGTDTTLTITDDGVSTQLALLNQYASQFAVSSSAYTLTADSTQSGAGTLLQLAAAH